MSAQPLVGAGRVPQQQRRTIADVLEEARSGLVRIGPVEAASEQRRHAALLVDIRPEAQRRREGEIPGSLVIERNVLEWRLDPLSDARVAEATGYELRVIVVCSEGYTSSLAAASLQALGLRRATDLVGGFLAWEAAGLPSVAGGTPADHRVAPRPVPAPATRADRIDVDVEAWQVHVGDRPVELTRVELVLLDELVRAQGRVLSRDQLRARLGERGARSAAASVRSVDVHVSRLRRKLGAAAAARLVTVRGVGLKLVETV